MNIPLPTLQVAGAASSVRVHYERLAAQLRAQSHPLVQVTQNSWRPCVPRAIAGILLVRTGMPPLEGSSSQAAKSALAV